MAHIYPISVYTFVNTACENVDAAARHCQRKYQKIDGQSWNAITPGKEIKFVRSGAGSGEVVGSHPLRHFCGNFLPRKSLCAI